MLESGFTSMIEITKNCNLNCKHCYIKDKKNQKELPKESFYKIMDKLKDLGSTSCVLLGGETLLHKEFFSVMQYAIRTFENVIIQTNGTSKIDLSPYPVTVCISFEDVDPIKNDQIRGTIKVKEIHDVEIEENGVKKIIQKKVKVEKGHYETALKYLRNITNPRLIRYTLYQDSDIEASIIMSEKYNASSIFVPLKELGFGNNLKHLVPGKEKMLEFFHKIANLQDRFERKHLLQCTQYFIWNNDLRNKFEEKFKQRGGICEAGRNRLFINSKGDVFLCEFFTKNFGNILKENGKVIKHRITKFFKEMNKLEPKGNCELCPAFNFCNGGCLAELYGNKKEIKYIENKNCPIIK